MIKRGKHSIHEVCVDTKTIKAKSLQRGHIIAVPVKNRSRRHGNEKRYSLLAVEGENYGWSKPSLRTIDGKQYRRIWTFNCGEWTEYLLPANMTVRVVKESSNSPHRPIRREALNGFYELRELREQGLVELAYDHVLGEEQ